MEIVGIIFSIIVHLFLVGTACFFLAILIIANDKRINKQKNACKLKELSKTEFGISEEQYEDLKLINLLTESEIPIYDILIVMKTLGLLDRKGEQENEYRNGRN